MIVSTLVISIILVYLFLIGLLVYGFDRVDTFKLQDLLPKTTFSILIPFRDEAKNLPKILDSVSKLNYSNTMFEIILIDDDSRDDSVLIIKKILSTRPLSKYAIRVIKNKRLTDSPKKDAITSGISVAKYNWIITTDADCILPKYWLDAFDECIQTQTSNCIVAPVTYHGPNSFFNRFQILDFLSLQGATIGAFGIKKPFMCNGANFGYRKSLFKTVNGFEGNSSIASGDDIFLLEKFIKLDSDKVHYLKTKTAIVTTNPALTITNLIQQRLRWASKTSKYNNWFAKLTGLVVLLANFVFIIGLPLVVLKLLSFKVAIALFVIKFSIDFLLLFKSLRFFKQETLLLSYLFVSVLYPVFSVYIALLSLLKPYEWKGRTFKK